MRADIVVGGIALTIVLLGLGIFIQTAINSTNDRQDLDIQKALYSVRESQYRACIINGNTLRDQVRREFVDLKRKVLIPTFGGIAATIPEGTSQRTILESQVAYLKTRIQTIKDRIPVVHCLQIYPPLPGQKYPNIKAALNKPTDRRPEDNHAPAHNAAPRNEGVSSPSNEGVVPSTASTPPSITTPPSGGDGGNGAPGGNGGDGGDTTVVVPPTQTPPSQPQDDTLLGPTVTGLCDSVGNLGVALC